MTSLFESPLLSRDAALQEIAAKTKPLGALGRLEEVAVRLSLLQGTLRPHIDRARVCIFGADHGVVDEGVSAYPRAVTGEMMRNFDRGGAAINVIAAANDVSVEVIDVGVDADLGMLKRIRHERVRPGTRNFANEPALTHQELDAALGVGAAAARRAADDGIRALGLGEMGIGNTTAAAAVLGAFTRQPASVIVGRGTGVNDAGLERKCAVVETALQRYWPTAACDEAREVLCRVGGLELAAIAGAGRAGAELGVAIIVDGFISTVAILAGLYMARAESNAAAGKLASALFFAHRSAERGHNVALAACAAFEGCDAGPLLDLDLRLGEGTGAALAMPLFRAAAAVMREMATFSSAGVSAGDHADAHSAPNEAPVS
jgi:nicotinate-nucleotide--dimethylbenzimidazole phosphoribosyltransferase